MNQMPKIKVQDSERWRLGFLNIIELKYKAPKPLSSLKAYSRCFVNTFKSLKWKCSTLFELNNPLNFYILCICNKSDLNI